MEPILHLIIPLALILAFFPKIDRKLVFMLSPLAFIPDLDVLFPGWHRVLFGNIFFVILISLIVYSKLGKEAGQIGLYFLSSHLLLDLSKPGTALFWPVYDKFIYIQSEIIQGKIFPAKFNFAISTMTTEKVREIITSEAHKSYYLATQGTLVIILTIILIIIYLNKKPK